MDALYSRLEEYYPKNISYTEDIVKAFLGTVSAVDIPNDAGNILATQIYGLPVFYAENSSTFSERWSNSTSTSTSTFAFSLSWYTFGDKQTWNIPPARTSLFPSWSWASVKTHRNLQKTCNLSFPGFPPSVDRRLKYEDVEIWVTFEGGERVELEEYTAGLKQYAKKTLAHSICIRGWTTSLCPRATMSSGKSSNNLNYATDPDYPMYQPSHDLSAVHLRSPLLQERDGAPRMDPVFLIVERADGSTWRRVGLCKPRAKRYAKMAVLPEVLDFLKSVDLKGVWGVRKDWEVRTLCLI
jgi:hypothetical protein